MIWRMQKFEARGSANIKVASSMLDSTAVSIFIDIVVELKNTAMQCSKYCNAVQYLSIQPMDLQILRRRCQSSLLPSMVWKPEYPANPTSCSSMLVCRWLLFPMSNMSTSRLTAYLDLFYDKTNRSQQENLLVSTNTSQQKRKLLLVV